MVEDRIAALEARTHTLEERVRTLEGDRAVAEIAPPVTPPPPPVATAPRRPARDLEEFLGGSVLAWLGGTAVVAGLAFLLTVAVSRGWLGEGARTALAGAISLGLLGLGFRLRERRGRNDAALSAAAAGLAGAFGTLVVTGQAYDLLPTALALLGALAVGGAATVLAIRWRAQVLGWIGLVGALLAPAVLGAYEGGGMPYLAVAYAATVAVLVWQRWTALGFAAFALATPQWLFWLYWDDPSAAPTLALLIGFGALTTVAAIGFELRRREPHVRASAVALLVLNALVLAAAGWNRLPAAEAWLVALAAAHLAVGLAGTRISRVSRELALIALGLGIVLADVAFAALTSGLPLALAWAAGAVGFGALLKRATVRADRVFALAGLGGHLLSALAHALVLGGSDATGLVAVATVAAGAAISGRLAHERDPRVRIGLDALALALVAYLSVLALDGLPLALAFAGEATVLARIARRERDPVAAYGAVAFVNLALSWTLIALAPPSALVAGLDAPTAAAAGLAASAGAALLAARAVTGRIRAALLGGAAVTALYLASVVTVTLAGAGFTAQTLLSVLWATAGVGTLVAGLRFDRRGLRRAALVLLAVTAAKVCVYDLASLTSLYRVGSLIGLGLLLLCGAFAWQRLRPLPLPDLRAA